MKVRLRTLEDLLSRHFSHVFFCPGCQRLHGFNANPDNGEPRWQFNGDLQAPTVQPSIRVQGHDDSGKLTNCHSYITSGMIQFLGDCTHGLANQTVPLPAVPFKSSKVPAIGQIVIYVTRPASPEQHNGAKEVPAIIVRTWEDSNYTNDEVNLKILTDGPVDYWRTSVPYHGGNYPGTWHWQPQNA